MQEMNLVAWGKNYTNVSSVKNKVKMVAVGENHIIFGNSKARDNVDKQCWGMGSNRFGQLGLKDPQFYQ